MLPLQQVPEPAPGRVINFCSGLATLQGSARATLGCLTRVLEGILVVEEEEVAGNMEQASVSSATGKDVKKICVVHEKCLKRTFYPSMDLKRMYI